MKEVQAEVSSFCPVFAVELLDSSWKFPDKPEIASSAVAELPDLLGLAKVS